MPNSNNPPASKPAPYTIMQLYKDLGAIMCDTPAAADIALGCDSVMAYIAKDNLDNADRDLLHCMRGKLETLGFNLMESHERGLEIYEQRHATLPAHLLPADKGVH